MDGWKDDLAAAGMMSFFLLNVNYEWTRAHRMTGAMSFPKKSQIGRFLFLLGKM
jgi:hypothetical protein